MLLFSPLCNILALQLVMAAGTCQIRGYGVPHLYSLQKQLIGIWFADKSWKPRLSVLLGSIKLTEFVRYHQISSIKAVGKPLLRYTPYSKSFGTPFPG